MRITSPKSSILTDLTSPPVNSNHSKKVHPLLQKKQGKGFWSTVGVYATYQLVDAGLAHFLGLETLIHGTSPLNYLKINFQGADPSCGGRRTGSTAALNDALLNTCKGKFHVFKDSEWPGKLDYWMPPICAKAHNIGAGMASFNYSTSTGLRKKIRGLLGGLSGFFTPVLKFRFKPEDIRSRFKCDPFYKDAAYHTTQSISPVHLGITGSLTQGLNSRTFRRMSRQPAKVLLGTVLLGAGAMMCYTTYRYITEQPSLFGKDQPIIKKGSQSLNWQQTAQKYSGLITRHIALISLLY